MSITFINNSYIETKNASIPVTSLSFTLGASVFEAIRVNWNEKRKCYFIINFDLHIRRLYNSLKILRMDITYTSEDIKNIVTQLVKKWALKSDGYIRITAYIKDSSLNGSVYHPNDVHTDLTITINEKKWNNSLSSPIKCCVSSWTRINDNSMPPRVKSAANYENTRLAGQEAILNGYDNAILLNNLGKVSEAAESVLFLIDENNNLVTPNLESDILNSINRRNIIKLWNEKYDKSVIEKFVDRTELYLAKEIFICNTAKLIRPVIEVDKIVIGEGEIGVYTKRIATFYDDILRGNDIEFHDNSLVIYDEVFND